MNNYVIVIVLLFYFLSCNSITQENKPAHEGLVLMITNYNGRQSFIDTLKTWYKDSVAIEEIHRINIMTDASNNTSINYSIMFYRFIDLRSKALYDYKAFSDTSKIFDKDVLSDSLMKNRQGWNFYSNEVPRIQGIPKLLTDTVIDNITYKRAKFHF